MLIAVFAAAVLQGHVSTIENHQNILTKISDDTSRVNQLNDRVTKLQYSDPAKALTVVNESITLAEKMDYSFGLAVAYRLRGVLFADQTKLDSAKFFYDKAIKLIEGKKDRASLKQFGLLKHNYGVLYHHRQELDSATQLYFEAAKVHKEIDEDGLLFFPYANLVAIYSFLKDNKKALQYAIESRKVAVSLNDTSKIAMAINNEMAARLELKQYNSVSTALRVNIRRSTMVENKYALAKANHLLGQYFVDGTNQYDSAAFYFNKALEIHTTTNNQYEIAGMLHNLGYAYKGAKQYDKASEYLTKSNQLAKSLQLDQVVYYNLENLFAIEESLGNIPAAYSYLKQFVAVKDSLQNRNNQTQVNDLEKKYQTEIKDNQLKLQRAIIQQKNTLNYLLISGLTTLLLITTLSYRNYRHRQKLQQQRINELETEKQLTATEAVLKGEEQERTRLAKDLHDGLGGMLSGIKYALNNMKGNLIMTPENAVAFERSIDMLDSSIKEMRRVAHNMMPESLVKFGLDTALRDLCSETDQSGVLHVNYQSIGLENTTITQTTAIAIFRIVQELLHNSVKHASAKNSIVQVTCSDGVLSITVEDDGKGFDAMALKRKSSGMGWSNIHSRVEYLKGQLDMQSQIGKGTSVWIEIPIQP